MPIAVAIAPEAPAEAAEQENDQDDDEYRSKRHGTLPVSAGRVDLRPTGGSKPYSATEVLEHDPEKVDTGFPKRSCSNKKMERDDDSKKSQRALRPPLKKLRKAFAVI